MLLLLPMHPSSAIYWRAFIWISPPPRHDQQFFNVWETLFSVSEARLPTQTQVHFHKLHPLHITIHVLRNHPSEITQSMIYVSQPKKTVRFAATTASTTVERYIGTASNYNQERHPSQDSEPGGWRVVEVGGWALPTPGIGNIDTKTHQRFYSKYRWHQQSSKQYIMISDLNRKVRMAATTYEYKSIIEWTIVWWPLQSLPVQRQYEYKGRIKWSIASRPLQSLQVTNLSTNTKVLPNEVFYHGRCNRWQLRRQYKHKGLIE